MKRKEAFHLLSSSPCNFLSVVFYLYLHFLFLRQVVNPRDESKKKRKRCVRPATPDVRTERVIGGEWSSLSHSLTHGFVTM